jgi:hypothetical protein
MQKSASIYFDKGVLVIDFEKLTYKHDSIVTSLEKEGNCINISFIERNWGHINYDPTFNYLSSDVHPYSEEWISKALPEYVEEVVGYWKSKWFGLVKKWIPAKKRLKEGWVEFEPSKEKTIATTQYRIINKCI